MATMKGKRVLTSLYLDPPVQEALRRLSEETRVPQAVYLREAVDDLLAKYRRQDELVAHFQGIADNEARRLTKQPAKHK